MYPAAMVPSVADTESQIKLRYRPQKTNTGSWGNKEIAVFEGIE